MKTLGLIGGTTWHSTLEYYRDINEQVAARLGGLSSARMWLHSVNFDEVQPPTDAEDVQAAVRIPLLHIADATADAVAERGLARVALLGTRPTMEHPFFQVRLAKRGIEALVPDEADREYMHASILGELGKGIFTQETRARYAAIIEGLVARGAQGAILACTEIPLLFRGAELPVAAFDTMALHVRAAVEFALG